MLIVQPGPTNFIDLYDVPHSYSGQADKTLTVKSDSTGIQFSTVFSPWASVTGGIDYTAGNVGIGTTPVTTAKLTVASQSGNTGLLLNGSGSNGDAEKYLKIMDTEGVETFSISRRDSYEPTMYVAGSVFMTAVSGVWQIQSRPLNLTAGFTLTDEWNFSLFGDNGTGTVYLNSRNYNGVSNNGPIVIGANTTSLTKGTIAASNLVVEIARPVLIQRSLSTEIPLSITAATSQSANILNVTTNGGTAGDIFQIKSTGNVGIGTAPDMRLHIAGASGAPSTSGSVTGGSFRVQGATSSVLDFGNTDSSPFGNWIQSRDTRSATPNTYYSLLLNPSGGNVGVGTTDPASATFQVKGSIFASGKDDIFLSLDDQPAPRVGFTKKNGFAGMFAHSNTVPFSIGQTDTSTIDPAGYSSLAIQFTVDTSGNVGIATTPTSLLHVNGSFATGYIAKTANYTATISDATIDCTSNTFTVTLPTAVGITGRQYVVKNSGTGVITLATTSSQTIDGVTTKSISVQYQSYTVQSNGANWIII